VRLGARISGLEIRAGAVAGVRLQSGETCLADAVVLATNHHAVEKWVPMEWRRRDPRFAGLQRLRSVPILGAHLWFDRPVLAESHAALLSGPLQWVFRKDEAGRALHGVISAAGAWEGKNREQMLREFEGQVRDYFPAAREAQLERGVVVIEKRATFSPLPGIDQLRPLQAPSEEGLRGLYLAGDYTRTGWPATMEGAVRSGYLAAGAVLQAVGRRKHSVLVTDLPAQWPARMAGLRDERPWP
jgi:uncharacterized protein with NAD-binding domain and iron-sulfur cluster